MKRLGYAVLALLAAAGLAAIGYRLVEGMSVTRLTSPVAWGMWVAYYIYFIGLSAGSFLLSTMVYVFRMHALEKVGRLALLAAIFALGGGLVFVWIDLGHPERFLNVFLHWNHTSVLAWESVLYLFYIAILSVELWLLMRDDLSRQAAEPGLKGAVARCARLGYQTPESEEERRRVQQRAARRVPLLGALPATRRSPFWLGAAGFSMVVGIVAVRLNLVVPAYVFPMLPGLEQAFTDSRLVYQYFPSPVEWISSTGLIALVWLIFLAACGLLPVKPMRARGGAPV